MLESNPSPLELLRLEQASPEIQPVVEATELSPEELFAQHVRVVREDGDAVDAMTRYHSKKPERLVRDMRLPGLFGAISGFTAVSPHEYRLGSGIIIGVSLAATTVAAQFNYYRSHDKAFHESINKVDVEATDKTGEIYELYKIRNEAQGTDDIVLRWCGPIKNIDDAGEAKSPKSLRESLTTIADLSEQNDIKIVLIDDATLESVSDLLKNYADHTVDMAEWLKRKKSLSLSFKNAKGVAVTRQMSAFKPGRLRQAAIESACDPLEIRSFENSIKVLRVRSPAHPLIKCFDQYSQYPKLCKKKIGTTARLALERNLNDVDLVALRGNGHVPEKRKIHTEGRIEGRMVVWQNSGNIHSLAELSATIGMSISEAEAILRSLDEHTVQKVITAAEYLAYIYVYTQDNKDITDKTYQDVPIISFENGGMIQPHLGELTRGITVVMQKNGTETIEVDARSSRRKHCGLALAAIALGAGIGYGANHALEVNKDRIVASVEEEIAGELKRPVTRLNSAQRAKAAELAIDGSSWGFVYKSRNKIDDAGKWIDAQKSSLGQKGFIDPLSSGSMSGLSQGFTYIGNTKQGDNSKRAEWEVFSSGSMDTKGYWSYDSMTQLESGGRWSSNDYYSETERFERHVHADVEPQPDTEYIEVARDITPDLAAISGINDEYNVVRIPVLDGTVPVAGNINSLPIKLVSIKNGISVAAIKKIDMDPLITSNEPIVLTYYVSEPDYLKQHTNYGPFPFSPYSSHVNAFPENEISGTIFRDNIHAAWDAYRKPTKLQNDYYKDALAKIKADVAYIKENFAYDYEPLDKEAIARINKGDWAGFVREQMKDGNANCNVAGNLLAINNPTLNVVTGYNNQSSDTSLAAGEAHMWNVDTWGTIHDATPSKDDDGMQSLARLKRGESGFRGGPLLAAGLLLGSVGAFKRRNIVKKAAETQLKRYSESDLVQAKNVADMAAFAPYFDTDKLNPIRPGQDRDAVLGDLTARYMHSDLVADSLDAVFKTAMDRTDRKAVRKAKRIMSAVKRAGMVMPLKPVEDIQDML